MDDEIRKAVGERVRAAMTEAGLTQQKVADELGLPQSQLSRRLAGLLAFDVVELEKAARLCGVPTSSFLPAAERAA
jgi:transcriptional regulator with XRE-family HTH domain